MKCKRCRKDMKRIRIAEHSFSYRCPECGLTIEHKREAEAEQNNSGSDTE